MPAPFLNFRYTRSALSLIADEIRIALVRRLTKNALPLFLRGRDRISFGPLVNGAHEAHVKALIDAAAAAGYSKFLIDIGANIGLTSCQSGNAFDEIHFFEPNPLCCKILEANASIALHKRFVIYPFGLGLAAAAVTLMVPKDNWGGAFIADKQNAYSAEVLAKKDGYAAVRDENYIAVPVEIKDGQKELAALFGSLAQRGQMSGVIKVDAEGFESVILDALARALPAALNVLVVYESWGDNAQIEDATRLFGSRAKLLSFRHRNPWRPNWPRWLKVALLVFSGRYQYALSAPSDNETPGEMVLVIDSVDSVDRAEHTDGSAPAPR